MALPKNRISKAKRNSRRANWKITAPAIVECSQCKSKKLAHRVCKTCGFYDGVKVEATSDEKSSMNKAN